MINKYTFLSLCDQYDKIEIPIIQRDYAQGRDNTKPVRDKFVEYIGTKLSKDTPIELDFVYGNVRKETGPDGEIHQDFIPIDGQQRLTTLFLLHWFLSVKDNKLEKIKSTLKKFVYETRPSAHDFCKKLTETNVPKGELSKIRDFLINREWFDNNWLNDGTVSGMLTMLQKMAENKNIISENVHLSCLQAPKDSITFYFLPLESFGLSDDMYIRMNARGKILTEFENFKSEFYKTIYDYPDIESVKDKMEYSWVNNMWEYKSPKTFVTDDCFMHYLDFITEMLYFKREKYRSNEEYAKNFIDLNFLKTIYNNNNNTNFLVFALDILPGLKEINGFYLWDSNHELNRSINSILKNCFDQKDFKTDEKYLLYSAIVYRYEKGSFNGIENYLRVVRNLIVNTDDKSSREWPRIIESFEKLAKSNDMYDLLANKRPALLGLRNQQCDEEYFKATLFIKNKNKTENIIFKMEDNKWFKGSITNILLANECANEESMMSTKLNNLNPDIYNIDNLDKLYDSYETISENEFEEVFGDLIDSSLYSHNINGGRLVHDSWNFSKCPAILYLAKSYRDSIKKVLDDYLIDQEKRYIIKLNNKFDNFEEITDVKIQLKLLYIITRRILGLEYEQFFKDDSWNFGWLEKETGFTSLFKNGINNDPWFSNPGSNPIFQTYRWQFRYNLGLKKEHALDIEVVGSGRPHNVFDKLIEWAKSK